MACCTPRSKSCYAEADARHAQRRHGVGQRLIAEAGVDLHRHLAIRTGIEQRRQPAAHFQQTLRPELGRRAAAPLDRADHQVGRDAGDVFELAHHDAGVALQRLRPVHRRRVAGAVEAELPAERHMQVEGGRATTEVCKPCRMLGRADRRLELRRRRIAGVARHRPVAGRDRAASMARLSARRRGGRSCWRAGCGSRRPAPSRAGANGRTGPSRSGRHRDRRRATGSRCRRRNWPRRRAAPSP